MKISVTFHPCIQCLNTCPQCKLQPKRVRWRQAEAALKQLKIMFPGLVPDEED